MTTATDAPGTDVAKAAEANASSPYGLPEVQRGLLAVAYANGNCAKASRDLAEDGLEIPKRTLHSWAFEKRREEYERVRAEILPMVGAEVADEHMALARRQIGVAEKLAERLDKEAADLPIRDVPGAMRNASVGAGIHTEKARDLAGDFGTPARGERTAEEVLRSLAGRGLELLGEPAPVHDAQVVHEEDVQP